jgi:hypothetical protein
MAIMGTKDMIETVGMMDSTTNMIKSLIGIALGVTRRQRKRGMSRMTTGTGMTAASLNGTNN